MKSKHENIENPQNSKIHIKIFTSMLLKKSIKMSKDLNSAFPSFRKTSKSFSDTSAAAEEFAHATVRRFESDQRQPFLFHIFNFFEDFYVILICNGYY